MLATLTHLARDDVTDAPFQWDTRQRRDRCSRSDTGDRFDTLHRWLLMSDII